MTNLQTDLGVSPLKTVKSFFGSFFTKKERAYLRKQVVAFLKKSSAKSFCSIGLICLPMVAHADTVSAAVGRPLRKAETLIAARNYPAALVQLQHASAAGTLTPYERAVIAQLRGAAEAGEGNYVQAAVAYEAVLASGAEPASAQLPFMQAIAGFYYSAADAPDTITWVNRYIAAGGTDVRTRALLAQAYYQQGEYAQAEAAVQREHGVLPEAELQLLEAAAQKANDPAGDAAALQALLSNYPNPQYWNAAITQLSAAPDFPDRLTLDLYRLRLATHTLTAPGDYEDYTERAILAGHPAEARQVIDAGFSSGVLNTTTDHGHAARLKALADGSPPPGAAAQDPLQAGIDAYQAGADSAAEADFKHAETGPDESQAALARLWAICAHNAAGAS
jgi:tetratricopeptide (TPR) repeat protein